MLGRVLEAHGVPVRRGTLEQAFADVHFLYN
jgi:hypothetical protein